MVKKTIYLNSKNTSFFLFSDLGFIQLDCYLPSHATDLATGTDRKQMVLFLPMTIFFC